MSTRGLYHLKDGTFVRTQGEIPKGQPINKIEVPVDSKGLCEYLNALIAAERAAVVQPIDAQMAREPFDAPFKPPEMPASMTATHNAPPPPEADHAAMRRKLALELRGMEVEAIEERILEMKAPALGRVLAAGVERFGYLGKDAWDSLHGFLKLHSAVASNYDRGLHMLSLHQIERLNEPKAQPKSYKELNG